MKRAQHVTRVSLIAKSLVVFLAVAALLPAARQQSTAVGGASGEDWPMYRHDAARSGITSEKLALPLKESWVFEPRHAPQPAWPPPKTVPVEGILELPRVNFDVVFHVAVADGALYFGSSSENKVYSLDVSTGQVRWARRMGGPVRLAPTVWRDRVFVGSDDGFAHCLNASDGSDVWKFQAAPYPDKALGHGKMASLWPMRTGVLVDDGIAYFSAGIFPMEGVYIYAVRAEDGQIVWRNDSCGEETDTQFSPQGYLLASKTTLFVPMGRVSPVPFSRKDGQFLQRTYFGKFVGGAYAVLADDQIFTGTEESVAYNVDTRSKVAWYRGRQLLVTKDTSYMLDGKRMFAIERTTYPKASLKLERFVHRPAREAVSTSFTEQLEAAEKAVESSVKWQVPCDCSDVLILAGDTLFAGGANKVVAVESASGKTLWTAEVDGRAYGLAVAAGRLFVSTDKGRIYCFGPEGPTDRAARVSTRSLSGRVTTEPTTSTPYPQDALTPIYESAAERIVQQTGIKRGYCLVLGCGTGRLAYELAKRTDLTICALESDAQKAEAARKSLDAAGMYGARVTIEQCPYSAITYPDYFANLIVSDDALVSGQIPVSAAEAFRMLKPCGGVLLVGQPAEAAGKTPALSSESLRRWASDGRLEGAQVNEQAGVWLKLERGALPGAGSWTHQYADPGNTTCSDDQLVKCPLGVLWFGEPGPAPIANRHERSQSPLAMDGRLFIEGENVVMAYDSYNGLLLWKRELPGTPRILIPSSSGNFAMSKDSLFVALRDKCYRLDVATGDITQTYDVPKGDEQKMAYWDYMAYTKGLLYGSRSARQNVSNMVFAMNPNDGSVRWTYAGKEILPSSISMGDGKLFLIDRAVSDTVGVEAPKVMAKKKAESADMRTAVALDAMTGKVLWRRTVDVTGAGSGRYFQSLSSIYQNDVLVLFGIFIDGHHWKDFLAGDFEYRRIIALSGSDGNPIWSKNIGYRVRPIVVGDTLHAEPWAYSLYTGEQKTRTNPVTGRTEPWQFARPGHHCGAPAAAPHIMLARSYTLGYYDLDNDYGIMNFGGLRPGCWINFIPANGLLLMPESAAGCMCPFPNQCSVMFKHRETNRAWAQYSAVGSMTPVKHLAINLGAPGDRLDKAGTLWLAYPRGGGSLVLQLGLVLKGMTGAQGAFRHNPETAGIEGTESPWIFSSGYNGLSRCAVPLLSEENGEALYTVRLGFADPDNSERGQRVFDIKLQGKVVQKDFDVVAEAGGKNKAVTKEFKGIGVKDNLIIELVPKASQPSPPPASRISLPASHLPLLNSLEVIRENVLGIGCAVPSFMLSSAKREQSGEIKMANDTENQFDGTLRIDAPTGFKVTAEQTGVDLAPGAVAAVKIAASVADNVAAGKYQANVKLIRKDGTVECERQIQIEYLADRERIVAKAIADAHVMRSSPDTNAGNATTLNVDGGDATVGDNLHSIAFLKFRLAITGTPQSATLRLYNGDNPSGDSGRVCLVTEQWDENKITYSRRPEIGKQLAKIGRVAADQVVEIPLNINVRGMKELSLAIDPTSSDGIAYFSRESSKAPELIIELAGE